MASPLSRLIDASVSCLTCKRSFNACRCPRPAQVPQVRLECPACKRWILTDAVGLEPITVNGVVQSTCPGCRPKKEKRAR